MVEKAKVEPDEIEEEEIEGSDVDKRAGEDEVDPNTNDKDKEREAEARAQGWVPEDEWDDERAEKSGKRKPAKFKTAEEFLAASEQNPVIERERLRYATRVIERLEKKVDDLGGVIHDQRRLSVEAQKRAYEKGLTEAKALRAEAIKDGDLEKADEAQDEIERIKTETAKLDEAPKRKEPEGERKGIDPRMQEWVEENPWFNNDPELHGAMVKAHSRLIKENPGVPQADLLEDAADLVKRRHPDEFNIKTNPRRQGAAAVNGSTGNRKEPASKNGKSWADVPEADRAVYERHRKMIESTGKGAKYTREDFITDYFSQ